MTPSSQLQSQGFLYVAFGHKHTQEAIISVASLRKFNPDANIAVVTDQDIGSSEFNQIIRAAAPELSGTGNYHVKIEGLRRSPFERTIFLDTDTVVCGDLTDLFPLFDKFDILVTLNTWRVDRIFEEVCEPYSSVPKPFIACNTGVIGFAARPVVESLFAAWAERTRLQIVEHTETADQPSFRWAIYHSSARFAVLSSAHNYCAFNPGVLPAYQTLAVIHDRRPLMAWYAGVINKGTSKRPRVVGPFSLRLWVAYRVYSAAGKARSARARLLRLMDWK